MGNRISVTHGLAILLVVSLAANACKDTSSGSETDNDDPEPVELEITSAEPLEGVIGTNVTIHGTGFDSVTISNTVTFSGVEVTVTEATPTELITTVPDGASTGFIEFETDGESALGPQFEVITWGVLEITTTTDKPELEPDGYQIFLDGMDQGRIDTSEVRLLELDEGSYELEIGDFINFCSPTGAAGQMVNIAVGDTTSVAYEIVCEPLINDQIVFGRSSDETGGRRRLYIMDSDGSNVLELTHNTNYDISQPAISPDGEQVAYLSNVDIADTNFDVFVMDVDGNQQVRLTSDTGYDEDPSWSPDGTNVMFESSRGGNQDIYTILIGGTGLQRITTHSLADMDPHWSSQGDFVFVSTRYGKFQIFVSDIDGMNQTPLTDLNSDNFSPSWSPDGSHIVFISVRDGNREIYIMEADGSNQTRLTYNSIEDLKPSWGPDGNNIIFHRETGIFKMHKDGTGIVQLTNFGNYSDGYADWGPK